ncbi:MAG: hypothetical protein JO247_15795 [Chloroflexi bacterium]|nr:hypothetical protein [Chloroflexota bacterium]
MRVLHRAAGQPLHKLEQAWPNSEFLSRAGVANDFAVYMDLITPDESGQIIRDFAQAHPEMADSAEDKAWMEASREALVTSKRRRRR